MRKQFDEQLRCLNLEMVHMAGAVETAISRSVKALRNRDTELAKEVITNDSAINSMEREIEHRCLKLLLCEQPVANDLRRVSAALKMITDMERIGDHAADIAELIIYLSPEADAAHQPQHIHAMAESAVKMLTDSINAYVYNDEQLALRVIAEDDVVDDLFLKTKSEITEMISADKSSAEQALDMLMIAKYLERIGDHAVNIAEWVIFSITGFHKDSTVI